LLHFELSAYLITLLMVLFGGLTAFTLLIFACFLRVVFGFTIRATASAPELRLGA
jgi:hypothetical protein